MTHTTYLLLGSNLGDRRENLDAALRHIRTDVGAVLNVSPIYVTEPWGMEAALDFYNMAAEVTTPLKPEVLMARLLKIENKLGRSRTQQSSTLYASRTIDIDILYFDDVIIDKELIQIPHPRLHLRRFALQPMNDLNPSFSHPILGLTQAELLARCDDDAKLQAL